MGSIVTWARGDFELQSSLSQVDKLGRHLISLGPSYVGWKTRDSDQIEIDGFQTACKDVPPANPKATLAALLLRFPYQISGHHSSKQKVP